MLSACQPRQKVQDYFLLPEVVEEQEGYIRERANQWADHNEVEAPLQVKQWQCTEHLGAEVRKDNQGHGILVQQ